MPPTPEDKRKRPLEDELDDALGPEGRGFLPDLLRRGLTLGFTGLFLTEEAVRKVFGDSVPREWMDFVIAQSERTRAELLERFSRELGRVFSALDPVDLLRRLLDGHTIEVTARIRFAETGERRSSSPKVEVKPNDAEPEPDDPEKH